MVATLNQKLKVRKMGPDAHRWRLHSLFFFLLPFIHGSGKIFCLFLSFFENLGRKKKKIKIFRIFVFFFQDLSRSLRSLKNPEKKRKKREKKMKKILKIFFFSKKR